MLKNFLVEIDKQRPDARGRVAATQTNLFMEDDCAQRRKDTPQNLGQSIFFIKTLLTS